MYGETSRNPLLDMFLQTVSAPLLTCILGAVAWWLLRKSRVSPSVWMAPTTALGFMLACTAIQGRTVLPPISALDVLVAMAVGGTLLDWLTVDSDRKRKIVALVAAAVIVASFAWMLFPILERNPPPFVALAILVPGLGFLLLTWFTGQARHAPVRDAIYLYLALGIAPVIALDGSLKVAQIAGALATCLGVAWLGGLLFRRAGFSPRVTGAWLITGIYTAAWFYAGTDLVAMAILFVGILLLSETRQLLRIHSAIADNLVLVVAGSLPMALALWRVWPSTPLY